MNINEVLFVAVILLMAVIAFLLIPQFLYKRAIKDVIKIFRKNNALTLANAKTPKDLGLAQKGWIQSLGSTRDYKPRALQLLMNYDVVRKTEDGRVYLLQEKLATYKLD